MDVVAIGHLVRRVEARIPGGDDPRVTAVFWGLAAQVPVLALAALASVPTNPLGVVACAVLGAVAAVSTALILRGLPRAGARLAITVNVAVYAFLCPLTGGASSPTLVAVVAMVLFAALALGLGEALIVTAFGVVLHAVWVWNPQVVPALDPWSNLVGHSAILVEVALLAGLASHGIQLARSRATTSEHALQKVLAQRDTELELRRAADLRLTDAVATAKSASDAKSSFLANMSHELRTPLNAILGYAEMLGEEIAPDQIHVHHDLGRIVHAGKHLLALINDVLDLSKIEAGRLDLLYETFDVGALVHDLAETTRPLADKNRNALVIQVPGPLGELYGDPTRVRQIVLNLLSNAAKFTSDGQVELTVRRVVGPSGADELRFEVRDTGVGISPRTLPRLFQPFVQADSTTSRKFGGTGLGLGLAARLAQMMYGTIGVESELDVGSTFTFTLPILSHAGRMAALCARRVQEAPTSARPVVLCVDDEAAALEVLDRTLLASGMHPIPVIDPRTALELARQIRPSVITLDVRMPELDGLTLLGRLKADPDLARIPVVMVSIHDDAHQGFRLGAADYLPKPINRARLVAVVGRLAQGDGPILLVEDDDETRRILKQTLSAAGYPVVEATNGTEAIRELERIQPRAVVLDLMMPVMDGFTVADRMRDNPSWAGIPILVVTAADLGIEDRNRLAHCVGLYSKTGGLDAVIDEIKRRAA